MRRITQGMSNSLYSFLLYANVPLHGQIEALDKGTWITLKRIIIIMIMP